MSDAGPRGEPKVLRNQHELPTTDGTIAVGNFEAQVDSARQMFARDPMRGQGLTTALIERASVFGRLADYDRALEVAEGLVKRKPADASSWLARASVRAALHRFAEAEADLAQAQKLGAPREQVEGARATMREASGGETLALRQARARVRPGMIEIGEEAAALADVGRFEEAERRFAEAQDQFHDVSPFPVAWLYFQYGLAVQKQGRLSAAREAFEAVRARLPGHAQATAHLAAIWAVTGDKARAVTLLRELTAASDDPEYQGQLAALLDGEEARVARERAGREYDVLLKKHPEAFADHAARFWLGVGGDASRALSLAQRNLTVRKTRDAYQLAIEAARAAHKPALACQNAEAALALPHATATLHLAAARAFAACGQQSRADAELAAATR